MIRQEHDGSETGIGRVHHRGKVVIDPAPYGIVGTRTIHTSRTISGKITEAHGIGTLEGWLDCEIHFTWRASRWSWNWRTDDVGNAASSTDRCTTVAVSPKPGGEDR
jgi:hypothetical protein